MPHPSTPCTSLTEEQNKELVFLEKLKPLLALCLNLNHDLNNPLAGIIGYAEFLHEEADQLSEEHKEFVGQIVECAERMKTVLDALCEVKMDLSREVDLRELVATYTPTPPEVKSTD